MLYKKWSLCYKLNSAVLLRAMPSVVAPGLQGDGWHRKRRPVCWYGGLASTCHLAQVRAGLWRGRRECLLSYHTGHRCWVCGTSTRDYKIKTRTHTLTHTINHTHTNTHTHTITHSHTLLSTDDYKKKLTHTHVRTHAHAHAHTHIQNKHLFVCLWLLPHCRQQDFKADSQSSTRLPDLSDEHLLKTARSWLVPHLMGCRSKADIQKLPWSYILKVVPRWSCEYIVNTLFMWIHCSIEYIVRVNTLFM